MTSCGPARALQHRNTVTLAPSSRLDPVSSFPLLSVSLFPSSSLPSLLFPSLAPSLRSCPPRSLLPSSATRRTDRAFVQRQREEGGIKGMGGCELAALAAGSRGEGRGCWQRKAERNASRSRRVDSSPRPTPSRHRRLGLHLTHQKRCDEYYELALVSEFGRGMEP